MKSGPCPWTAPPPSFDSDAGVAWLGADTDDGAGAGGKGQRLTCRPMGEQAIAHFLL